MDGGCKKWRGSVWRAGVRRGATVKNAILRHWALWCAVAAHCRNWSTWARGSARHEHSTDTAKRTTKQQCLNQPHQCCTMMSRYLLEACQDSGSKSTFPAQASHSLHQHAANQPLTPLSLQRPSAPGRRPPRFLCCGSLVMGNVRQRLQQLGQAQELLHLHSRAQPTCVLSRPLSRDLQSYKSTETNRLQFSHWPRAPFPRLDPAILGPCQSRHFCAKASRASVESCLQAASSPACRYVSTLSYLGRL